MSQQENERTTGDDEVQGGVNTGDREGSNAGDSEAASTPGTNEGTEGQEGQPDKDEPDPFESSPNEYILRVVEKNGSVWQVASPSPYERDLPTPMQFKAFVWAMFEVPSDDEDADAFEDGYIVIYLIAEAPPDHARAQKILDLMAQAEREKKVLSEKGMKEKEWLAGYHLYLEQKAVKVELRRSDVHTVYYADQASHYERAIRLHMALKQVESSDETPAASTPETKD